MRCGLPSHRAFGCATQAMAKESVLQSAGAVDTTMQPTHARVQNVALRDGRKKNNERDREELSDAGSKHSRSSRSSRSSSRSSSFKDRSFDSKDRSFSLRRRSSLNALDPARLSSAALAQRMRARKRKTIGGQVAAWRKDLRVYVRRNTLEVLLQTEGSCAVFFLVVVPYQLAFSNPDDGLNWLFCLGYFVDAISLSCSLIRLWLTLPDQFRERFWRRVSACRRRVIEPGKVAPLGKAKTTVPSSPICTWDNSKAVMMAMFETLLVVPYDAFFWGTSLQTYIPVMRLSRALLLHKIEQLMAKMERSHLISFGKARIMRMLVVVFGTMHVLACVFYYVSTTDGARHFQSSPWITFAQPNSKPATTNAKGQSSIGDAYLRASYWALASMTTVGHVDVLDENPWERLTANWWEVAVAILYGLIVSFVYIYITANFTSMILQQQQALEQYRSRAQSIDGYLKRNHVTHPRPPVPTPHRLRQQRACPHWRRKLTRTSVASSCRATVHTIFSSGSGSLTTAGSPGSRRYATHCARWCVNTSSSHSSRLRVTRSRSCS